MNLRALWRGVRTLGRGLITGLPDATADRDPVELFREWFAAATDAGILLPEAMVVATADRHGAPSARTMLLKGVDARGFVFYTNYGSRKALQLAENPSAALVFHWAVLQRQVTVEGRIERVDREESEAYFRSRLRGSRIGAWASRQSEVLDDRRTLVERVREVEQRFTGADVPLPPFWGGFRLWPERIEFWQGRAYRLHDRMRFTRTADGWVAARLYP
jgi:pyridoxamine 5'-phosphate oxidase